MFTQKNKPLMAYQKKENMSECFYNILAARGINTEEKLNSYIEPILPSAQYISAFFTDMLPAVNNIKKWIKDNHEIIIVCNGEAGNLATMAVIFAELRRHYENVACYIPSNPYCPNSSDIINIQRKKVIAIGCGTYSFASELADKTDSIFIDEKSSLEKGILLNTDKKCSGLREMPCICIAITLLGVLFGEETFQSFIDMAAMGILLSDSPVNGINRAFLKKGLQNISQRPFIRGMADVLGLPEIRSFSAFRNYTDLIKTMTWIDPKKTASFFCSVKNAHAIISFFKECLSKNNEIIATAIEEETEDDIICAIKNYPIYSIEKIASSMASKYGKPVAIFSNDCVESSYMGFIVSVEGFTLKDILSASTGLLESYTGISNRSIVVVKKENIDSFINFIKHWEREEKESVKYYDTKVSLKEINKQLLQEMSIMEPFGLGNPVPVFLSEDVSLKTITSIGKKQQHYSASVYDKTACIKAVQFNHNKPEDIDGLDILFKATISNNGKSLQPQCIIGQIEKNNSAKDRELASSITQYGVRVIDEPVAVLDMPENKLKQLAKAGIHTIRDLINYLPKRYDDFRFPKKPNEIVTKERCSMVGIVRKINTSKSMTYAVCFTEDNQMFMACWFHQAYVERVLEKGAWYIFCGEASVSTYNPENPIVQIQPDYFGKDIDKYQKIIPLYKKIEGMSLEYLQDLIHKAIYSLANTDYLEKWIVEKINMPSEYDAIKMLHNPSNDYEIRDGQKRKVFDELFEFNFILKNMKKESEKNQFRFKTNNSFKELQKLLPYQLTNDQKESILKIFEAVKTKDGLLNALVQGDVGSGKTMVALFSMAIAAENGIQSCLIAPTEVLASQHYKEFNEYMSQLGYNVGYLVGGMKAKEKKAVLQGIADGSIHMVVGTHAVVQDSVKFNSLGLLVVDEQHKFGVAQREKLRDLKPCPHTIAMSATPIPRTLSMAIYGDDIDIYSIKEKPAGRKDIITKIISDTEQLNQFMLSEIRMGRQCYVVCPLIEKSSNEKMSAVKSVQEEAEQMIAYFSKYPEVKISNVTGKMKNDYIAEEIRKFKDNETNILLATTIIEVGVNVPNATVMVIKSSERFGLAQAHQLRGRVGRGSHQSYCLLQTSQNDEKGNILCSTNDGFEIAKQDMLMRGPGDYIGTKQTGSKHSVELMLSNQNMYKQISEINDIIYSDKTLFAKYAYILES